MTTRRARSPMTAATLSLLFPGLGQYASGARRRGTLIAIPALALLTFAVGFAIGTVIGGGAEALFGLALRPRVVRHVFDEGRKGTGGDSGSVPAPGKSCP